MKPPRRQLEDRLWHLLPQPVPEAWQPLLADIENAAGRAAADAAVAAAAAAGAPARLIQKAYRRFLSGLAYRVSA